VDRLYAEHDYMTAYRTHTDMRVLHDPHAAVGSMWEEIGTLQFDYLVRNGLKPDHRMLDIGCGTLRGGRHFIRFLDIGRYTGTDISPRALEYAERLVAEEGLSDKRPVFILDRDMRLRFEELEGSFDCILAQSVFTHLPEDLIASASPTSAGSCTARAASSSRS
jgi:SAM-dependent methyltransferase